MILITGGTGFLGKYIVQHLHNEGYPLRLFVQDINHPLIKTFPKNIEIIEGNILDITTLEKTFEEIEYVVHSAAMVGMSKNKQSEMRAVNETGTENIANLCIDFNIKKLVHISSSAALGRTLDSRLRGNDERMITEQNKFSHDKENSYYGYTKYLAEKQIHRGVAEGLNAVQICPAVILGNGSWWGGTRNIFQTIHKRMPFYPPGSNGFIYAPDVAKAIAILLKSNLSQGEKFILSAETIPYHSLFDQIATALNRSKPTFPLPKIPAFIFAYLNQYISTLTQSEPSITPQTVQTAFSHYPYSGERFAKTFNFQYTPIQQAIIEIAKKFLHPNPQI